MIGACDGIPLVGLAFRATDLIKSRRFIEKWQIFVIRRQKAILRDSNLSVSFLSISVDGINLSRVSENLLCAVLLFSSF